jgi:hypothetical protein
MDATQPDPLAELAALREVLAEHREVIASQQVELERLRRLVEGSLGLPPGSTAEGAVGVNSTAPPSEPSSRAPWSRRALLLGGLGATAGAAASLAGAGAAAAVTGTMEYGAVNNAGTSPTALTSSMNAVTLRVQNFGLGSALQGVSDGGVGVIGTSTSSFGLWGLSNAGIGVVATSANTYGLTANSNSYAAARLSNAGSSGPPTTGTYDRGALFAPTDGSLWWCVVGGTPGTWRLVTSPLTTAFIPITPTRVYDSRAPQPSAGAQIAAGTSRDISVASGRDLVSGAVTAPNIVPSGARAVFLNLTIAGANAQGTVALAPGGSATYSASAINFAANERLANGLAVSINPTNRTVRAFAVSASVAVIIDVYGYYQ